ncbi:hypothetical protein ACVXHM_33715 [Pseudomonas aeruginosa]|nr:MULTISPECIES: hypothetical protein [Pseudomonas]MCR7874379.1 hypothetical protein [Pseudomonas aeruginosa]UTN35988.1 hypothetical protein MMZ75_34225 [Pseudomonas aeruginosa]
MPKFDAIAEAARLKLATLSRRKKTKGRVSKLNRYKYELLALHSHGASSCELQAWLAENGLGVQRSTITRWLAVNAGQSQGGNIQGNAPRNWPQYTVDQFESVVVAQKQRNSIASRICCEAGLRPREVLTIRPLSDSTCASELSKDNLRNLYEVDLLGGGVRVFELPQSVASELESYRLADPILIADRGSLIKQRYFISGGAAWAKSFNDASKSVLGWSIGVQGVRNMYLNKRMSELQASFCHAEALHLLAMEVGGVPRLPSY